MLRGGTAANAALAFACTHEFGRAVATAEEALQANPTDMTVWTLLGYIHRSHGDDARACRTWERGVAIGTDSAPLATNWRMQSWLANMEASAGHAASALKRWTRIATRQGSNGYVLYRGAHVLAALGHEEEAVATLRKAMDQGFRSVQLLKHDEQFALDAISGRPDYHAVVDALHAKVGAAFVQISTQANLDSAG